MNPEGLHLETTQIAAYLDRVLNDAERDRVEAHLATCGDCRREVIEVARLKRRPMSRRTWWALLPAAAAAVLAVLLLRPGDAVKPVLRDDGSVDVLPRVIVVAPAESVTVTSPQFVWHSAGSDASYRFTMSDTSGDVMWSGAASDTILLLPSAIRLQPGRSYFWYVDALLPDGRSVSSGVRRLVLTR